jgi:hypothetical protein
MTEPPGPRHPPEDIRLQVLLRPAWRNARGVAEVERALRDMGFEVTGTGRASISARAAPRTFREAFAARTDAEGDESPGDRRALPVPAPLAGQVESITVAPQHTAMSRPAKSRNRRGRT